MTIKEAKKEIQDYFNLEMTPHAEKKLIDILSSIKGRTERVIETKYVYVDEHVERKAVDINQEAIRICDIYGITIDQLRGRRRLTNYVSARAHLIREMRMSRSATMVELAEFLNMKDHSSVINLCYHSKTRCLIEPLHNPKDTYHATK